MKKLAMFGIGLFLWLAGTANAQTTKVCLADIATAPSGEIVLLQPCHIVASPPFSLSKDDYDIYGKMLIALANASTFMNAEVMYPKNNHDSDKALIAASAKEFKEQRKLFCQRHPEMAVFNISEVADGPEFRETYPEACKQ